MCSEALISVATIAGFSGEVRLPPSGEAHTQCRWNAVSYQVGPKADLHLRKHILKLKNWIILWCQRKPPVIWSPKMNVLTSELIWSVTDQSWPGRGGGAQAPGCTSAVKRALTSEPSRNFMNRALSSVWWLIEKFSLVGHGVPMKMCQLYFWISFKIIT